MDTADLARVKPASRMRRAAILLGLLLICLILAMAPGTALAVTDKTGQWNYTVSNGTATINGWNKSGDLVIPREVDGYIVDTIWSDADRYILDRSGITSISFPDTLLEIGPRSFRGASNITELHFPKNLKEIGFDAFKGCGNLRVITFPAGVKTIGSGAFDDTRCLEKVTVNSAINHRENYDSYGTDVFKQAGVDGPGIEITFGPLCKEASLGFAGANIKSVSFPDAIESIGPGAFRDCASLKEVKFGKGLKEIKSEAFKGCSSLTSVSFPQGIESITGFEATGLREVVLPEGIKKIGRWAFCSCPNLRSVSLPDSVEEIEDMAFESCPNLSTVTLPSRVKKLGYSLFTNNYNLGEINFDCVEAVGTDAFLTTMGGKIGVYTDGVVVNFRAPCKAVPANMFYYSCNITCVNIADSVKEIGDEAFSNVASLENVVLPTSVKEIGQDAFYNLAEGSTITARTRHQYNLLTASDSWYDRRINPDRTQVIYRPIDMSEASVSLGFASAPYDGRAKTPGVQVRMNGTLLTAGKDYSISYANNVNAGTATVAIKALGSYYTGVTSRTFKIAPLSLSGASVGAFKNVVYSGKAFKPAARVSLKGKQLAAGKDFTVTYKANKNAGKATVTIAGKGNYAGKVTKTFKILPTKGKLTSVKKGAKSIKVKWKKNSQATGYKIQIATNKKFTKNVKTVVVKGKNKTTKEVKKLKAKKKYYVRVCAYKKVGGASYAGAWSAAKMVRTK